VTAAHRVADTGEERAPAQAQPLSTAAPVAMVANNRGRRAAVSVPVCLLNFMRAVIC